MFLIKIEEVPPDHKPKSTDVLFSSKWEAECFIYDMNIKRLEREGDRIFFKLAIIFLIAITTFSTCVLYSLSENLYNINSK